MILNSIFFGAIIFSIRKIAIFFSSREKLVVNFRKNIQMNLVELLFFSTVYFIGEFISEKIQIVEMNYFFLALVIIPLFLSFDFFLKPYYYNFFDKKSERLFNVEEFILKKIGIKIIVYKISTNDLNMYATGILNESKSILIGGKMLNLLTKDELYNIVYHEIGHLRKNHLLVLYLINVGVMICYFFSALLMHPIFLSFSLFFEGLFVFCHGMVLGLFLVVVPGAIQKKLELSADREAIKYTSKNSFISTLNKLNSLSNGRMDRKSINYPTLSERIKNVEES
jgi:Zn-dependent protease with chaperone function